MSRTFKVGSVTAEVTITDVQIISAPEQWGRTVKFDITLWAFGYSKTEKGAETEQWMAGNASGGEGWSMSDLTGMLHADAFVSDGQLFKAEGDCDALWEEIDEWFGDVASEISSAQQNLITEYIERANDGVFDGAERQGA